MSMTMSDSIFIASMANALIYIILAAPALGLGVQQISAIETPYTQAQVKSLLGIPQEFTVYELLAIGYPDMVPRGKR